MPDPFRLDPAEPEDLPEVQRVSRTSNRLSQLKGSRGGEDPSLLLYAHLLATSEGGFWVARRSGQVVGFSAAVPRGPLWFVCELRVDPEQRNQGIGRRLLSRAKRSVRGIRGRILAGLAGPDPAGLALGVGAGMMPRCAIVRLHGDAAAARKLWRAHAPGRGSRVVRYDPDAPLGPRSPLVALDRAARGAARPQDHRFWLAAAERRGMLVWHGKRPVAYLYVGQDGGVGPAAGAAAPNLLGALAVAAKEATKSSPTIRLRVAAIAGSGLEALLAAGFRVVGMDLLLASSEFGRPDLYVPAEDSLF